MVHPRHPFLRRSLGVAVLAVSVLSTATGCSSEDAAEQADLDIVAGFYPAEFLVKRLVGDAASVRNLAPPGAEAHHLELTPDDVIALADADLIVTLEGFQHAVDHALEDVGDVEIFDLGPHVELIEQPGTTGLDYHFWLDPTRMVSAATALAAELTERLGDDTATQIEANLATLTDELTELDGRFETGLATCESNVIVTGHTAFGYLAKRYGLEERGIAGLDPEDEPSAKALAELATFVTEHGVTTIFFETLISPAIAQTLAAETGASTAVLDPIEGLSNESAGEDYLSIMDANLEALRAGLRCS